MPVLRGHAAASRAAAPRLDREGEEMARVFMIVLGGGLLVLAGGVVYLGAFPPTPASHQVQKVIPNDLFKGN
ncbi:MAG TPA: hypothetical protein VFA03_01865 [Acetobacteraceae bacterium]|nr:hypothetical protein [Acetobacteraceae bacterium]